MDEISALLEREVVALAEQESATDVLVSVEPAGYQNSIGPGS